MGLIGRSIVITGEVRSSEDLTIEGRIEGPVLGGDFAVVVAEGGVVSGDIIARDITVYGSSKGQLVATEVVDVRKSANASGQVVSPRFILHDEAMFVGRVEPQHLNAALKVAEFKRHKGA